MAEFDLEKEALYHSCQLLTASRWTSLEFIAMLKEAIDKYLHQKVPGLNLNVGIHVVPDFTNLTEEIYLLFQIAGGVAWPHLFINHEPVLDLPNLLLFQGTQEQWQKDVDSVQVIDDLATVKDPSIKEMVLSLLVQSAKRLDDGFTCSAAKPRDVVRIMGESPLSKHAWPTVKLLRCEGFRPDFSIERPAIMQDKQTGGVAAINPEMLLIVDKGIAVQEFLKTLLAGARSGEHLHPNTAVNDLLHLTIAMGRLVLHDVGLLPSSVYQETKVLVQQGFVDPRLPKPHLTPKGVFLRDLVLLLGYRNLQSFVQNEVKPIGLGDRRPVSGVARLDERSLGPTIPHS